MKTVHEEKSTDKNQNKMAVRACLNLKNQKSSPSNYKLKSKSNSKKKHQCLSTKAQEKQLKPNIVSQYAVVIEHSGERSSVKDKAAENSAKLKRIQKKYIKKIVSEEKQWPKRLFERRSMSSSKQSKKSMKSSKKLKRLEKKAQELRQQNDPENDQLKIISKNRYIRLRSETKKSLSKRKNSKKKKCENLKSNKKLRQELSKYKQMYIKSLQALTKMSKHIRIEKQKFQLEKNVCLEQIRNLQGQIDSRKNLGHLFTFKQYDASKLLPDSLILQKSENISEISQTKKSDAEKCEQLLQEYLQLEIPSISQDYQNLSNLSLESK